MGYKLRYGSVKPEKYKKPVRILLPLTLLLLIVSVTGICSVWPVEMAMLRQSLFPWTAEPVQNAVSGLEEDLKAGEPLEDALAAFCREILANAP